MNKKTYSAIVFTFLTSSILFAQDKKSDLGTEVVDVVRSYDATISDAFKVRETPNLNEDANTKKKPVVYTINSFPVASTFIPEKGKAADVERETRLSGLNNYVYLGVGNYLNINADAFVSKMITPNSYLAASINHFSSQGGIKNLLLDDTFSKSRLSVIYGGQTKKLDWKAEIGGSAQMSNWYGLPTEFISATDAKVAADKIDSKQKYTNFFVNGTFDFNDLPLKSAKLHYDHFSDYYNTTENRFVFKPNLETKIGGVQGKLGLVFDYVGTDYAMPFGGATSKYSNFNIGLEPSVVFADSNYSVELGLGIYNNNGTYDNESDNSFHIYPQVKASYKLVENIVNAYAGVQGGLRQNSYRNFVAQNPFVSPNIGITPTDERFNVYVGLKGKLDHMISYNIKGSYKDERDRALFVTNPFSVGPKLESYMLGNSFGVEYADLKTLNLFGELTFDFDKDVSMRLYGEYNNYDTNSVQAWNLPETKVGADFKFDFTEQWFAGMELFYVGSRYDRLKIESINDLGETVTTTQMMDLKGYVDLNLRVGYRPTKNWTVFLKGNNLLDQEYSQYGAFRVQGIQVMGGAMYKFDF